MTGRSRPLWWTLDPHSPKIREPQGIDDRREEAALNLDHLRRHLEWAEDRRKLAYLDTATPPRITAGVGRNLSDKGLSEEEIDFLLDNDIAEVLAQCGGLPYWYLLDDVRQLVVADMVFNLGLSGWQAFKKANAALLDHDYDVAAYEMQDSKWYGQTGRRARKLVDAMRTGVWTVERIEVR